MNAANSVILNNDARMGKNLWTEDKSGDPIKIFSASDEIDEANFVIESIQNHIAEDFKRNEIAILYEITIATSERISPHCECLPDETRTQMYLANLIA